MASIRLTVAQARHAWLLRQRLAGENPRKRSVAETVGDLGWIPLASTATAYLALFARGAIAQRSELDEVVAKRGDLVVVPGPRGSSWLVPTPEAPLARAFAVADHASREARVAAGTTLTSRDLEGTRDALRTAMAQPATPEEIRARVPEQCLRSLGDAGRKAGLPTLAALVMRSLWVNGEIQRVSADGRLDGNAVRWGIDPRPRTVPTAAEAVVSIAPRWLAAHAPVTSKAFATAFGIAAGRANGALKAVKPVEVEVEGLDGVHLAPEDFTANEPARLPARLLPLRDPLTDVHLTGLGDAEATRQAMTRNHGVGPVVLWNGEIVGSWLYDDIARRLAWRAFNASLPPEASAEIDAEAQRVATFIAHLGGAALHTVAHGKPARTSMVPGGELSIEL